MSQDCKDAILSEEYADFITEYNKDFSDIITDPGICYSSISNYFSIAHIPINTLPPNFFQEVGYQVYPQCLGLLDSASLEASNVTKLRGIPSLNLNGNGVLIGIVDTGIDYSHEAFRYQDGTSRITSIWDQTIQSGTPPQGFSFGSEYTQLQINQALQSDNPLSIVPTTDDDGHGTFLAGIAAGNKSTNNNFSGVVSESEIVVVKLKQAKRYLRDFYVIPEDVICYQENDIMLGVEYLLNVALTLMRPISICIALGTNQGSHDGRDVLSRYLSAIADQTGVALVVAAGNEGNSSHHYYGGIGNAEFQTVELKVGPNDLGFTMEIWGQAPNTFSLDILSPTGEYIPRIPARLDESRTIRFVFETTIIYINYFLVESQTGDPLIHMRFYNPTEGIWRFRIYSTLKYNTNFHIWLPIQNFIGEQTFFTQPNSECTLTEPANSLLPIVATAYNYTTQNLLVSNSKGFTRDNKFSPDITAPGVNMVGPAFQNSYKMSSGTSVSAAHTTGIAAMLLEWGIVKKNFVRMDSVEIDNLLKRGAKRDPSITYPNPAWGFGILDIFNTFNSIR